MLDGNGSFTEYPSHSKGLISGSDFSHDGQLLLALDSGQLCSVVPGKDRLIISPVACLPKPSKICLIENTLLGLSSAAGGAWMYRVSEDHGEFSLLSPETAGSMLSEVYYGPVLDAQIFGREESRVVAICGHSPSTVREFSSYRKTSETHRLGNVGEHCKAFWPLSLRLYSSGENHVRFSLLLSYIGASKILCNTTEMKLEEAEEIPIIATQETIYAAAAATTADSGGLLQVTTNCVRMIMLCPPGATDLFLEGVVVATSAVGKTGLLVAVASQLCVVNVYTEEEAKGKLRELFRVTGKNEVKSLAISPQNLLLVCTDQDVLFFNTESGHQVGKVVFSLSTTTSGGILGDSIAILSDTAYIGTKSGYILCVHLKSKMQESTPVATEPMRICPVLCASSILIVRTISQTYAIECAAETGKVRGFARLRTRFPVVHCTIFDSSLVYLDAEGNVRTAEISTDSEAVGMDSRLLLVGGNNVDNFTRILASHEEGLFYLLSNNASAGPSVHAFLDTPSGWTKAGTAPLEPAGRVKDAFVHKFATELSDGEFLAVATNSWSNLEEAKGQLSLYKISGDGIAFERHTSARYENGVTAMCCLSQTRFVVACDSMLYIMDVDIKNGRAKFAVRCSRKTRDVVQSNFAIICRLRTLQQAEGIS